MIKITGSAARLVTFLFSVKDDSKLWELKEHVERRSLSQSAYYWKLLGELAQVPKMPPQAELHNLLLRGHPIPLEVSGELATVFIPDTDEAERTALKSETFHIMPYRGFDDIEYRNGKMMRKYLIIKGTHEMNINEMSVLIEGLVYECKEHGIETMTPRELEELRQLELSRKERHAGSSVHSKGT